MGKITGKTVVVGLRDSLYGAGKSVSRGEIGYVPSNIIFDRDHAHEVEIFTDNNLDDVDKSSAKCKIAWIIESPKIHAGIYKKIAEKNFYTKFDLIVTFYKPLLKMGPRFASYVFGGCWIEDKDWKIYEKTKEISIISSAKKTTSGHRLRHKIIRLFKGNIDGVFGGGYQFLDKKIDGLKDYKYSIVVENTKCENYFTEKIVDCFAVGTIPIYWGCPNIGDFFDMRGIYTFDNMWQLRRILKKIESDPNDYEHKLSYIKNNFEVARKYATAEDQLISVLKEKGIIEGAV
jgi:hypothetical protein